MKWITAPLKPNQKKAKVTNPKNHTTKPLKTDLLKPEPEKAPALNKWQKKTRN